VAFLSVVAESVLNGWFEYSSFTLLGGLEDNIYDGAVLIIPFPLIASLQDYKNSYENYFFYYGR
jgi:hypothetical protein